MNFSEKMIELQNDLARARGEHFKLVWLVGGSSSERTDLSRALSEAEDGVFVALGKKLSGALLEVPIPLRTAAVEECFTECLATSRGQVTCIDNLEILFESSLKINPVSLIKGKSRHRLIVASWPGTHEHGHLVFAPSDHPAHTKIAEGDLESLIHSL